MSCVGEPISWLRLERYALAELDGAATAAVRTHLEACAACRAALSSIEGDAVALPPLPARRAVVATPAAPSWWQRWWRWSLGVGVGLTLPAAALLMLWLRAPGGPVVPGRTARIKGSGVVSLTLVRDRAGVIAFDPADVAPDDRWKAQLTCSTPGPVWTDLVVYQLSGASFPLPPQPITCGNAIALPGAFRVTGGGATICVVVGPSAPDRTRLARSPRRSVGSMVCAAVSVLNP